MKAEKRRQAKRLDDWQKRQNQAKEARKVQANRFLGNEPPRVKPEEARAIVKKWFHPLPKWFIPPIGPAIRVVTEPEKTFDGPYGFALKLEKKGYKPLGAGHYSTVYAKGDSDKVIKVTRRPDGWIDYAHWAAKEGYAGRFAPRVFSYKKFTTAKSPFEVAVVERMSKTFYRLDHKSAPDALVIRKLAEYAVNGNTRAAQLVEPLAPGITDFLSKLSGRYKRLDDHGGNIMVRSDGSICWTDPITSGHPVTFTRLRSKDFTLQ